jgi:hypothetical protein
VVPGLDESAEAGKRGDNYAADHRFAAASEDAFRLAETEQVHRLADGVATGSTGAVDAGVRTAHLQETADADGGAVLADARHGKRVDTAGTALVDDLVLLDDRGVGAAAGNDHADRVAVCLVDCEVG